MKIRANILKTFIDKSSLNGKIMAINLNFSELGVLSNMRGNSNIAFVFTFLKAKNFTDYEQLGEIFIKDSKKFSTYLKTFDGEVTLEKIDDYILKVYDSDREGFIILGSELVCENVWNEPQPAIETTISVDILKDDLAKTMDDMRELSINKVTIVKKDDTLSFQVGSKGESDFFKNNTITEAEGDAKVSLGDTILSVYSVIGDKFNLKFGTDMPVIFEEKTDIMDFKCFVAPMIEND